MSDQSPKIITSFQSRLEINSALRALGDTTTEFALRRQAKEIVDKYGDQAIAPLLALLDTTNPQLRGGLGHVASLLDRAKIVPALRNAAVNRSLPDQARISAITILERFLDIEPEPAMYAGMASPEELGLQSLREVLAEARVNRLVLVEYLEQLAQEPPDVLLTMVRSAKRLEGAEGVEMLRLFAQDPYPPAAEEALQALGSRPEPAAATALWTLLPTLPPALRSQAERSLQKLKLRGVLAPILEPSGAAMRCLASPPDAQGNQAFWFIEPNADLVTSQVLYLLLASDEGLVQAIGNLAAANSTLPPAGAQGYVHTGGELEDGQRSILLLEAPVDYGRSRVAAALERNWATGRPTPLTYRLLNPLLWRWAAPQPAAAAITQPTDTSGDYTDLLRQPALATWAVITRRVYQAAELFLGGPQEITPQEVDAIVLDLIESLASDADLLVKLRTSLLALAEWLSLAGEKRAAEQAAVVAEVIIENPRSQPLLAQIGLQGLRLAMLGIARGMRWEQMAPV